MFIRVADGLRLQLRSFSEGLNREVDPVRSEVPLSAQLASLEEASAARAEQLTHLDSEVASLGNFARPR